MGAKENINNTHRENAPQNKTQTHRKNMSIDIWVVSALNQLFTRGSYTEIKFPKK